MFWRLDNKKAVLFPGICVRLRYVFRKEKKSFIFVRNSAVHAMLPVERKGYNDHIKRNLKCGLEIPQPHI